MRSSDTSSTVYKNMPTVLTFTQGSNTTHARIKSAVMYTGVNWEYTAPNSNLDGSNCTFNKIQFVTPAVH